MSPLTAKLVNCPNCTQKIGRKQRIEKCAICGKLLCTKCVDSSRFCSDCAKRIPAEFKQRLRWLNPFVPMFLVFVACVIIGRAYYAFPGYQAANVMATLEDLGIMILWWMGGFLLIFIAAKLPHFGTWLYYSWIAKPANRVKVEAAIKEQEEGRYTPKSLAYRFKLGMTETYKKWGNKAVIFAAMGCNLLTLVFWIIRSVVPIPAVSELAGVIWGIGYITSIIMVGVAAGFYCKRDEGNRKTRKRIEILSWGYLLFLPIAGLVFVVRIVLILGALEDLDIATWLPILTDGYTVVLGIQSAFVVLLGWQMLRVTPVWRVPSTYERKNRKWSLKWLIRLNAKLVLGGLAILFLSFSIGLLVIGIPPLYWVLPEVTYLFLAVFYVPVFVMLLKMLPWKPHRYKQVYWRAVKAFAVVVGISLVPILSIGWTNNTNDTQFATVFGSDWEAQAQVRQTARGRTLGRQYKFSLFDAVYGFEVPEVNEIHDIPYITDIKRYGNTSLNDTFMFDAYLPPGLDFGDATSTKLPVLIMMHGSGMDRGWENAWNIHRYFASQGYLVCDMSYGKTGNGNRQNDHKGYDFTDQIRQLGNFTWQLSMPANASYYHADMQNVFFGGRSLGGYYALVSAYGYNKTYLAGNFSDTMVVKGCIPLYPASDIGIDSDYLDLVGMGQDDGPVINGSSHEDDPNYNPQWKWYNPAWIVQNSTPGTLCPTLVFQGTHDCPVAPGWSRMLIEHLTTSGNTGIISQYLLHSHGCEALHWSPAGQSFLYYTERFLALAQ